MPHHQRLLGLWLALVLGSMAAPAGHARDLDTSGHELVPAELATVGVDQRSGTPVVLLRVPDTDEVVSISVGAEQARAILLALRDAPVPRPMTHDLMATMLDTLDARLERIIVDDLVDGTYLGVAELSVAGRDTPLRLDLRPSDGLALALRTGSPIELARRVLDKAPGAELRKPEQGAVQALGVTVVAVEQPLRERLGLPERDGVVVSRVTGVARARGLKVGALITAVNGETPASPMQFLELVQQTPGDERVELGYWQDGGEHSLTLPLDVPRASPKQSI